MNIIVYHSSIFSISGSISNNDNIYIYTYNASCINLCFQLMCMYYLLIYFQPVLHSGNHDHNHNHDHGENCHHHVSTNKKNDDESQFETRPLLMADRDL